METIEVLVEKNCLNCKDQPLKPFFELRQTGFAPGLKGHALVYDHTSIRYCRACMHGQIEDYSHDCFQWDEDWDYLAWFAFAQVDLEILTAYVRSCPNNFDPHCDCRVHRHLQDSFENIVLGPKTYHPMESDKFINWLSVDRINGRPSFRLLASAYYLYSCNISPQIFMSLD